MPSSPLTTANVVARGEGLVEAEVDGEWVALHMERGVCFGLNPVGSQVWRLIAEPRSVADICSELVRRFDVDLATCERQVLDLLEDLRSEGLLEVRS